MKHTALTTLLLAAIALAPAPAAHASGHLDAIVASYLEIHAQLAADKIDGVKAPAAAIAKHAGSMGEPGTAIAAAAKSLEQAGDLKAAREAFGPLSAAVIAAAKAEGWQGLDNVKLAFCPMVNASWLQKEQSIRNPFYGTQMLTCGEFREKS